MSALVYIIPAVLIGFIGLLGLAACRLSGRLSEQEREDERVEAYLAAQLEQELSSAA